MCFFLKEPDCSLRDGGYDLSSGHTLLKHLHTFVFLLTDALAFESVFAYAALMCTGTRLCVGTRLHRLHLLALPEPHKSPWPPPGGRGGWLLVLPLFLRGAVLRPACHSRAMSLGQFVGVILNRYDTA